MLPYTESEQLKKWDNYYYYVDISLLVRGSSPPTFIIPDIKDASASKIHTTTTKNVIDGI